MTGAEPSLSRLAAPVRAFLPELQATRHARDTHSIPGDAGVPR